MKLDWYPEHGGFLAEAFPEEGKQTAWTVSPGQFDDAIGKWLASVVCWNGPILAGIYSLAEPFKTVAEAKAACEAAAGTLTFEEIQFVAPDVNLH